MSTNQKLMYQDITEKIIGAAFHVHNALGKGLTEKTYENAMVVKLLADGLTVEQQKSLPVFFDGHTVGEQVVDLVVVNKVIVEAKAVTTLQKSHEAQLLAYLKNTKYQLGLLINFGSKVEFKRLIFTDQNR